MNHQRDRVPPGAGSSSFDLIDPAILFRELGLGADSVFLDIACGRGVYTLAAAKIIGRDGLLYAVDLWDEGIAALISEAESRGLENIKAMVADVGFRIPVDDGIVDVALMATVLHDLAQEGKAGATLEETARVLKPGGVFAVVEFNKTEGPPGPPASIRLAPAEVEALVLPFGFAKKSHRVLGPHNYLLTFRR
jgi:ubiquinone/menaquinone biosynthesis C-methylase UbiE